MPEFLRNVEEIRQRAIRNIEDGAVTEAYKGDKDKTVQILNEALATEIVCVLRYMHHYFMSTGVHGKSVSGEFKEHADAEREHADQIGERIQQLGGKPDFNPKTLLERSVSQYIEGETLADMIREDLIAERVVIQVYSEMIRYFRDNDPTTRLLLENILKDEEEHASDLVDLLYVVDPTTGKTEGQDPGTRPLSMNLPARQPEREELRMGQPRTEPGRAAEPSEAFGGRGSAAPAASPGSRGRPIRQRPQQTAEAEVEEAEDSAQMGATRAVRVTKPNRKKRVA